MKHNLDHHIKDRHIRPHKCNICEKGFGSEWMLEKHKNVTHLGLKPHVCNLCHEGRVSVQGVISLGGHFACLRRGFEFYEVKKKLLLFFKKKMEILLHF